MVTLPQPQQQWLLLTTAIPAFFEVLFTSLATLSPNSHAYASVCPLDGGSSRAGACIGLMLSPRCLDGTRPHSKTASMEQCPQRAQHPALCFQADYLVRASGTLYGVGKIFFYNHAEGR